MSQERNGEGIEADKAALETDVVHSDTGLPPADSNGESGYPGWIGSEELEETEVERNPLRKDMQRISGAANSLASARRTVRLLWIALIVSLCAHCVVPAYIITAMAHPEKVALMDGTQSLIITPLVPIEQSREILETISYWAAKSFLDRGPQGFDAGDTLDRVFLPAAAEKAKAEFKAVTEEFAKKNIHQKLEIARIDIQGLDKGIILSRVVGQILTQAQVGDEQVNQPQPITLNLKLARNPYLGRNQRYPYAVMDYAFGQPEQLTTLTRDQNK
jgi:phage shock protein PspC (stress-responsive transcriptional regulator)